MAAPRSQSLVIVAFTAALAALYGWVTFVFSALHRPFLGRLDYGLVGFDYMVWFAALRLLAAGNFILTRDPVAFTSYVNTQFADRLPYPLPFMPWDYPPSFIVVLLAFGSLGFTVSYVLFQIATAAFLALALLFRAERPSPAKWVALAALACPAASINVIEGQAAFLIAGLLVLGVRLIPVRPLLGGVVLGVLSIKPQFAILLPAVLLGGKEWRAIAGVAVSTLVIAAIGGLILGFETWIAWFADAVRAYDVADGARATGGAPWGHATLSGDSVFTCLATMGMPIWLAALVQAVAIVASMVSVFIVFRAGQSAEGKLIVLLACTILAAPKDGPQDLILLTIAGALWLVGQPAARLADRLMALAIFAWPLLGPAHAFPLSRLLPFGLIPVVAVFVNEQRPLRVNATRADRRITREI